MDNPRPYKTLSSILTPSSYLSKLPAVIKMETIKSNSKKKNHHNTSSSKFINTLPFLTTTKEKVSKEKRIYRVKRKEPSKNGSHPQSKFKETFINNNSEGSILLYPEDLYEEVMNNKDNFNSNTHHTGFLPFSEIMKSGERKMLFLDESKNLNTMTDNIDFNRTQKESFNKMMFNLRETCYNKLYKTIKDDEKIMAIENSKKKVKNKEKNNVENAATTLKNKVNFLETTDDLLYDELFPEDYKFVFHLTSLSSLEYSPEVREGASLINVGGKLLLFGGMSSRLDHNIFELDIKINKWKKLEIFSESNYGRYGHSTVEFKNGFLIYGGERQFNTALKIRDCLNDLKFFNYELREWKSFKTWGDFSEIRTNHGAVFLSKLMIIYGGVNNNGRILKDVMFLNLETLKWLNGDLDKLAANLSPDEDYLSYHSMTPIFKAEIKIGSIYHSYEHVYSWTIVKEKKQKQRNVQEEGIYVFGGKSRLNTTTNTLKILKIGCKPLKWIKPTTFGTPPSPRYQHSAAYCEDLNVLLVCGGRNEMIGILGDLFVLRIDSMIWQRVDVGIEGRLQRFAHCGAIQESRYIIFGGLGPKGFRSNEVVVIELNQKVAKSLVELHIRGKLQNLDTFNSKDMIKRASNVLQQELEMTAPKIRVKKEELEKNDAVDFKSFMPLPSKQELEGEVRKKSALWENARSKIRSSFLKKESLLNLNSIENK